MILQMTYEAGYVVVNCKLLHEMSGTLTALARVLLQDFGGSAQWRRFKGIISMSSFHVDKSYGSSKLRPTSGTALGQCRKLAS